MLEDILLKVNKPGRYIGGEWNVSAKDFTKSRIKFAISFPDLYEVGMSNLGFRIIYGIINSIDGVACERFFSPDIDMESALRSSGNEIFSLESKRKLKDFDIVGFSLSSELNYTNVLNILDLGAIPLEASRRDQSYPLVIAGGPCVLNPEPMHEFFDLFIFGEGEEVIREVLKVYQEFQADYKESRMSKEDLLLELTRIEGVYVPSFYSVSYGREGKIEDFKPNKKNLPSKIKKRFLKNLDQAPFPVNWLVPYIQIIHDRITLEVMRGCPNKCRFCQARAHYSPFRIRSAGNLLKLACDSYIRTGYEEISLAGLSVSDYPHLEELLVSLFGFFKEKAISVSLPSIKPKQGLGNICRLIAGVKKTGLTFAPEAGSKKLREIINKDFDEEGFFRVLEEAYSSGYQRVKLYFMIGLPGEEISDLNAIIDFSLKVSELKRKVARSPAEVNISVNTLIPKPHTPFQWLSQDTDGINLKQDYLKKKITGRRLKLNFHSNRMSFLEGLLSRGDRKLSPVIAMAFKKGARFDAWDNYLKLDIWLEAFKDRGVDPNLYLREKTKDEILPWGFLDSGFSTEELWQEACSAQKSQ